MSMLDKAKGILAKGEDKAKGLLVRNEDKAKGAVDKVAGAVDHRTKGKHSGKIESGVGKVKGLIDKVAHDDEAVPPAPGTTAAEPGPDLPPPSATAIPTDPSDDGGPSDPPATAGS